MNDEEGNVGGIVAEVNRVLAELGRKADIILVDDGSRDGTASEIKEAVLKHPNIICLTHPGNAGFGAAIQSAISEAVERDYEFAVFMDADLTMHPGYIRHFYEKMAEGYDFVIGSRFIPGGGMKDVPAWRKLFSLVGRMIFQASFRLPLTDYTQGFRAIRGHVLAKMKLTEDGFPILVEQIYRARRITDKFAEIPFILTTRKMGSSKFNYTPGVIWDYLKYALRSVTIGG